MDWHSIFDQARTDVVFLFPEAMLVFFGLATLLTDFLLTKPQKSWNALTAMLGVLLSGASLWLLVRPATEHQTAFSNSIVIDPFFIFFGSILLAATALAILLSVRYLEVEDEQSGEYYGLVLLAAAGMMFLACGNDLVVLFVALQTVAISFYVLTGYLTRERRANEAALKFMLQGAFSSAILAYGFSILYGIAGSTNLELIQRAVQQRHADFPGADLLTFLALGTITAGLLFKIAAVPFHHWAPDADQGALAPAALGRGTGGRGGALANPRHVCGDHPNQPEAVARVFVHRPGRIHSAWSRGRRESRRHLARTRIAGHGVLHFHLRVFQRRSLRRDYPAAAKRGDRRRD